MAGSKKRAKKAPSQGKRPAAAGTPRPASASRSPLGAALRGAIIGFLLAIVVLPGFAFFRGSAMIVVPIIAGAILGLASEEYWAAGAGSAVFGVTLGVFAGPWLTLAGIAKAVDAAMADPVKSAQAFSATIPGALFNNMWVPAVQASDPSHAGIAFVFVLGVVLCGGASSLVVFVRRSGALERIAPGLRERFELGTAEQVLGKMLMIVVLAVLFFSANVASAPFSATVDKYLVKGSYATDYMIYARTIQDVARGKNYYVALKAAAADDSRAGKPDHYNMPTASWVRMPVLPTVLAFIGGQKLSRDVTLGLLLGAVGAGLVGWALEKQLFAGAGTVVALLVMPYVAMTGTWQPAFLPDYWGGLLVLVAFGLLLNRWTYAGIVVTLFAALTREIVWFWAFGALLGFVWLGVARKRWLPAGVTAGGFGVVVAAYATHWNAVNTKYLWLLTGSAAGTGPLGLPVAWTGLAAALARTNGVADFAITPYTLYRFDAGLLLLPGFAFLIWRVVRAVRTKHVAVAELAVLVFLGLMCAAMFVQSYTSQYWAVMFMPVALAAGAGLVGEVVKASERLESLGSA